jgi:hypothetical protein
VDPPPAYGRKFVNISTRGRVGAGDSVLIAGFVVTGTEAKTMLVRAAGPTLLDHGVAGVLTDPFLRVYNVNSSRLGQNNNWGSSSQAIVRDVGTGATVLQSTHANLVAPASAAAATGAFALRPGSADAALVLALSPGVYTAHVSSNSPGATGIALVEVYELNPPQAQPRLVNVSTRGEVRPGADILIAGFVVQGGGPKRILLRGVGPALAGFGLPAERVLADPRLVLFDTAGQPVASNDDWGAVADPEAQAALRARLGAFALPEGSADAETIVELAPGRYTVHVSGPDAAATGIALVEVYEDTTEL